MSSPSLEQFIAAQQGANKKSSGKKWWRFGIKKVTKEQKFARRFEGDTRPYSERNAGHRATANFLSYFFQIASISGAAYGAYKMFWDWSFMGCVLFGAALVALFFYERLARWTSDKFWDERAAGRFDLRFAVLNFCIIWSIGVLLTLGGVYFISNDTATGPGGSASSNDPAYIAMSKQLSEAKADVSKAEKRLSDFKKDPNNLCSDGGKKVVCYNRRKALGRYDAAVVTAEERVSSVSKQMEARFGVIAAYDAEAMAYWLTVKNSRLYVQIGMFFAFLFLFEVCMWYRSKYDIMCYWEMCYARAYGRKPYSETKKLKARGKLLAPSLN